MATLLALAPAILVTGCGSGDAAPPPAAVQADTQTAAALEKSLKADFGLTPDQPLSTLLTQPGSTWPGHVTTITVTDHTAHVRTDLDPSSAVDKNLATNAATTIASLVRRGADPALRTALTTVSVEDAAGGPLGTATI